MKIFTPTSPDHALHTALTALAENHSYSESRNGPALRFPHPVVTEWKDPTRRISWSPIRDANPFLHFIEAAWMLAGANDVDTVGFLAPNMRNYSDDGQTLYGAYGYRWRQHFGFDQIQAIIAELRSTPTSRRCVLQMWDGKEEFTKATSGGKDVCCNTVIYFDNCDGRLNMTVSNRSNDIVWGAYGANVVHMSILHEYVAAQTKRLLGTYYQVSNNLHLYLDLSPVMKRLAEYKDGNLILRMGTPNLAEDSQVVRQEPLFDRLFLDDAEFLIELRAMFTEFSKRQLVRTEYSTKFLSVLCKMMNAFLLYKAHGPNKAFTYFIDSYAWNGDRSWWFENAKLWLERRPSFKD